jgi:hypothetical protein
MEKMIGTLILFLIALFIIFLLRDFLPNGRRDDHINLPPPDAVPLGLIVSELRKRPRKTGWTDKEFMNMLDRVQRAWLKKKEWATNARKTIN